jgi:DNA-binding protein HU-beta
MLNKQVLITKVTDATRLARKDVETVINTFLETIIERLSLGEKVNLSGFGAFEVRDRKGRKGVNPRNPDEPIQIPTVRVAKFRPGKTMKEAVK